ncbi:MAG: carbohydrate ABC transporter permease [Actinobacteria bacterium]|nr:carbohydrate ABC transporter permease [Actinomycetota bacterium]
MASVTTVAPTAATKSASKSGKTSVPGRGLRLTGYYLILLIIVIVFITPYLFSLFAAFKPLGDILGQSPARPPTSPTWANFRQIFTQDDFGRYLANTLLVTVILTIGQVTFSMMGAYAFAKMEFPGRDALFWMYLATLMVPNVVTLVPLYVMFAKAGLLNTYWAIFLPYTLGVPQAVFLMRQNFMTIPKEVMEAARLDGCSESRILWRIVVPISKPIIITATLLAFVFGWNNFLWPLIVTNSNSLNVLSVGTANLNSNFADQWNLVLAASLVALIPMVILFAIFQKYIVRSISLTGINR